MTRPQSAGRFPRLPRYLLTGLLFASLAPSAACVNKPKGIIEVEGRHVTRELLDKRVRQMKLARPTISDTQVTRQLLEGLAADALLAKFGKELTREDLLEERAEVEKDDKLRKVFLDVQKIYGQSGEDFVDIGMRPDVAIGRLHAHYASDRDDDPARQAAEAILREARNAPEQFSAIAVTHGATVETINIDQTAGIIRTVDTNQFRTLTPDKDKQVRLARNLAQAVGVSEKGEVLGLVMRTSRGFMVTRALGKTGRFARMEVAYVDQEPFADWFAREAADLRVCINDENLRTSYTANAGPVKLNCSDGVR